MRTMEKALQMTVTMNPRRSRQNVLFQTGAHVPGVSGVTMELGDRVAMFVDSPNDAVKQYNACIDTWSLRHLTSAEEYPDEEYLDMSKSSSLKDKRHHCLDRRLETSYECQQLTAS